MRRALIAFAIAALSITRVAADLTITTTTTIEGGLAAATGGGAPKVVTRIHGTKSRTDIDLGDQTISSIVDTATSQAWVLRHDLKTAQLFDTSTPAAPATAAVPAAVDASIKPTGQKRDIGGVSCDEFTISMKMDLASMAASGSIAPEAVAMLKGVRMNLSGSAWIARDAPGAAEYGAFQKAAAKLALAAIGGSPKGGPGAVGIPSGMEQLLTGFAEAPGIPYLTELTMVMEGSGQLVALLQQMGQMKLVSKVTELSTEPVADSHFSVPEGYTIVK